MEIYDEKRGLKLETSSPTILVIAQQLISLKLFLKAAFTYLTFLLCNVVSKKILSLYYLERRSEKVMSVNITQQRICRVISQQMLYFSGTLVNLCKRKIRAI